jgi:hypothetical protein
LRILRANFLEILDMADWGRNGGQNLGHEQVMTTFRSYGSVPQSRQAEIMRKLSEPKPPEDEVWKQLKKLVASRG